MSSRNRSTVFLPVRRERLLPRWRLKRGTVTAVDRAIVSRPGSGRPAASATAAIRPSTRFALARAAQRMGGGAPTGRLGQRLERGPHVMPPRAVDQRRFGIWLPVLDQRSLGVWLPLEMPCTGQTAPRFRIPPCPLSGVKAKDRLSPSSRFGAFLVSSEARGQGCSRLRGNPSANPLKRLPQPFS